MATGTCFIDWERVDREITRRPAQVKRIVSIDAIITQLVELRQELEQEFPLTQKLPAGMLLADFCAAVGLNEQETANVLGKEG